MIEVPPPAGVVLRAVDWHVATYGRALTSAIDGGQQVVMSPMERWSARLDYRMARGAMRDEWEGFVADMRGQGRYARFLMTPGDAGRAAQALQTLYDDDATFGDGTPFASPATVFETTPARARVITIEGPDVSFWRRGLAFALDHRAYRVTGVQTASATRATVRIAPGLRAAITTATTVSFAPSVPMRFTGDDVGRMAWSYEQFADVGIDMIEVFP